MPEKLSNECKQLLIYFFQARPVSQFSHQLQQVLLQYIGYECRAGVSELWLADFLLAMKELFVILDVAAKDQQKQAVKKKEEKKQDIV